MYDITSFTIMKLVYGKGSGHRSFVMDGWFSLLFLSNNLFHDRRYRSYHDIKYDHIEWIDFNLKRLNISNEGNTLMTR